MNETDLILRKALAIGADDAFRINADPLDSSYVDAYNNLAGILADQKKI